MHKTRHIWIISIFPEYFEPFLNCGVAASALKGDRGNINFDVHLVNLRDHTPAKYKGVDDAPFGGGPGMVMRADVLKNALVDGVVVPGGYSDDIKNELHVVYTSPRGKTWSNTECKRFAKSHYVDHDKDLVFICGRYEGIDERFINKYIDEQISVGDYVLTGGELAVLTILDSSLRFIEGTLGNSEGTDSESFENGLLEWPQYTRPQIFDDEKVPDVLLSGHHSKIEQYRLSERIRITKTYRSDLYKKYEELNDEC